MNWTAPGRVLQCKRWSSFEGEQPDRELSLLIGADSLADLPTWREPARILELSEIVVVNRGRREPDGQVVAESLG